MSVIVLVYKYNESAVRVFRAEDRNDFQKAADAICRIVDIKDFAADVTADDWLDSLGERIKLWGYVYWAEVEW